jgi:hypothetical protein
MYPMAMNRITLICEGVPEDAGVMAARDITEEFALNYPHERNVICTYAEGQLTLVAENDYDPDGAALSDEFSDVISACVVEPFDGDLRVISVRPVTENSS